MIEFDAYLSKLPELHSWDNGNTWNSGGFSPSNLTRFHELARSIDQCRVVETGAGNSTVTFLLAGCTEVTSIAPEADLFARILSYCRANGIPHDQLDARIGLSQWVLPPLAAARRTYDIGVIDGGHGWPIPFVDFCYIFPMLPQGGLLVVDDLQLHSCKELARWLSEEVDYLRVEENLGKAIVFRKICTARDLGDWPSQPYVVRMTRTYERAADPFSLDTHV